MKNNGFSLIELLVSISIISVLFGVGIAAYNEFNRKQIMTQNAKQVESDLRLAQNKALTGQKDCVTVCGGDINGRCTNTSLPLVGWFINFTTKEIYGKCSTSVFGTSTITYPDSITVTSSPSPIMFSTLNIGSPSATICLSGYGKIYKLSLTASGEIKDEGFVSSCP